MNKHIILPIATAVVGLGAGYILGIAVTKQKLVKEIDEKLNAEIASVRAAYNRDRKASEFVQVKEQYVTPSLDGDTDGEGFMLDQESEFVTAGVVNVFDTAPVLVAGYPNPTDENAPYLITVDQFHEEHDDYDKNSIVYYAGDLVLADETEAEIHDIPNTVSADFAEHFGDQSMDDNIVYYRNDRLGIDFEISLDNGLYVEKVLGMAEDPDYSVNPVEETFQKIARKAKSRVRDDRDD